MANATNKTIATDADVTTFVGQVEPETQRADTETLIVLFGNITGQPPKMWGPSIIGFGSYHYKYESGREGDSPRMAFSPRKANIVLYLIGVSSSPETQTQMDDFRARLGKHKVGKACLYINNLSDINLEVLEHMIRLSKAYMDKHHPE